MGRSIKIGVYGIYDVCVRVVMAVIMGQLAPLWVVVWRGLHTQRACILACDGLDLVV